MVHDNFIIRYPVRASSAVPARRLTSASRRLNPPISSFSDSMMLSTALAAFLLGEPVVEFDGVCHVYIFVASNLFADAWPEIVPVALPRLAFVRIV